MVPLLRLQKLGNYLIQNSEICESRHIIKGSQVQVNLKKSTSNVFLDLVHRKLVSILTIFNLLRLFDHDHNKYVCQTFLSVLQQTRVRNKDQKTKRTQRGGRRRSIKGNIGSISFLEPLHLKTLSQTNLVKSSENFVTPVLLPYTFQ